MACLCRLGVNGLSTLWMVGKISKNGVVNSKKEKLLGFTRIYFGMLGFVRKTGKNCPLDSKNLNIEKKFTWIDSDFADKTKDT